MPFYYTFYFNLKKVKRSKAPESLCSICFSFNIYALSKPILLLSLFLFLHLLIHLLSSFLSHLPASHSSANTALIPPFLPLYSPALLTLYYFTCLALYCQNIVTFSFLFLFNSLFCSLTDSFACFSFAFLNLPNLELFID